MKNGQNVGVQAEKSQKFLVILEKLGENEEDYNEIENLELFDENGEITDKVLMLFLLLDIMIIKLFR